MEPGSNGNNGEMLTGLTSLDFKKSYQVGDLVILTQSRQGLVRFIGHVDFDGGEELWFGVELLGGSIGHIDGSIHGKIYFITRENGGILVLETKILRRMTIKDLAYSSSSNNQSDPDNDDRVWFKSVLFYTTYHLSSIDRIDRLLPTKSIFFNFV